jgi:hypothetical protein
MFPTNRRAFLSDVGRGMLAAGLGTSLAGDLGISTAFAQQGSESIPLGEHAALVELMRSTPAEKLQPLMAERILKGEVNLKQLTAAGALANAVTFGGCDYIGFHTAMAMLPALQMSTQMAGNRQSLPVLKVMFRNAQQIQSAGGASKPALYALHDVHDEVRSPEGDLSVQIRDACRNRDVKQGEALLATVGNSPLQAFNALQLAMQDDLNVHRFVFAHRTYGLVGLLGNEYAYSVLRQCVRFCVNHEEAHARDKQAESPIRALVPKLLDQYKLAGKSLGKRDPGDEAVDRLSQVIYNGPNHVAAEAVAAALADGIDPEVVGEAISLASNLFVLRQGSEGDWWRTHGDAAGVHASDATNAWRNMARVAESRHAVTGLIVAAYHVGVQASPFKTPIYPTEAHRALIHVEDGNELLAAAEDAIRHNDQPRAAAAIAIYGDRGYPVEPVFERMLKYAVSEDGRLHGEKFFHTVREEYRTTRPAFRWRQVVALARVTASSYGYDRSDKYGFRAAGYEDACKLLGVEA